MAFRAMLEWDLSELRMNFFAKLVITLALPLKERGDFRELPVVSSSTEEDVEPVFPGGVVWNSIELLLVLMLGTLSTLLKFCPPTPLLPMLAPKLALLWRAP